MDTRDKPESVVFNGTRYRLQGSYYLAPLGSRDKHCNLHRAVWTAANGRIKSGHHIHHINGNAFDNRVENLECVPAFQHLSHHARSSNWNRSGKNVEVLLARAVPAARIANIKWAKSRTGKKKLRQRGLAAWAARKPMRRVCEHCSKPFETKCHHQRFCSRICKVRKKFGSVGHIDKLCAVCGSKFTDRSKTHMAKYCSARCKWEMGREHRRNRVKRARAGL